MKKTGVPALDKIIAEVKRETKRDKKVIAVHVKNLDGMQKIRQLIRTPKKTG